MIEPIPIVVVHACDSTHDLAIERCADEHTMVVVRAATQRAGRGRNGRAWIDDGGAGGSLLLTVVLREPHAAAVLEGLSVRAAAHVVEMLAAGGAAGLQVKHPNDIVTMHNEKVGGLLVDATTQGARVIRIVLSIGLNLTWSPTLPDRRTASLRDVGLECSIDEIAQQVARALIDSVTA